MLREIRIVNCFKLSIVTHWIMWYVLDYPHIEKPLKHQKLIYKFEIYSQLTDLG